MAVTLIRAYGGFAAGAVANFSSELEASLVAQGLATSGGTPTSGNQTTTPSQNSSLPFQTGFVYVAFGASSVTISIPVITTQTKVFAVIQQAAADGTLTSIVRTNAAAGVATITGNANATAQVQIAYALYN